MIPTILEEQGFKVIIFLNDHSPPHVHVRKGGLLAKVSLEPDIQVLRFDRKLKASELRKMTDIVEKNHDFLLKKWAEFHGEEED